MTNRPLYLAPMEDVTDPAFRLLCKRYGADRVYTEFVNADALVRDIASTTRKLTIHDAERPVAIQIYGREPEAMADAARIVETAKPDFIDINFGCPVKKVAGKGAGAGLLRDVPKMLSITRAVVDAVQTPVTVKTRLGWDEKDLQPRYNPLGLDTLPFREGAGVGSSYFIVDLAERLQDCGIRELAIHGRTRSQMYRGEADWTLIHIFLVVDEKDPAKSDSVVRAKAYNIYNEIDKDGKNWDRKDAIEDNYRRVQNYATFENWFFRKYEDLLNEC